MSKIDATKRVEFLAEQFDVFSNEEYTSMFLDESSSSVIEDDDGNVIAVVNIILKKDSQYEGNLIQTFKRNVKIGESLFIKMVQADPTENKIYLQWLLTVFTKFIKDGDFIEANRFANEDLPLANEYLTLFDANKRKDLFKKLSKNNSELLNIKDPTNINQYKNLEQVFDVIDPFIERDSSTLEKAFDRFVNLGEATIPVRDRNYTLYIPKTLNANVVLDKFASWCTTTPKNGMVSNYTNNLRPDGKKSKLYIIIDNNVYKGESNNLWQIHFETNQISDRTNRNDKNFYDNVLAKSEALRNFFHHELLELAKSQQKINPKYEPNIYISHLENFGYPNAMFDIIDDNTPSLTFNNKIIPSVPDLTRFKQTEFIYFTHCRINELHKSIADMDKLKMLVIPFNNIEILPTYLSYCKNLVFINLVGNKIKHIPNDISKLDPTNGGKLMKMSISVDDIGDENYNKLKKLLPSVGFESITKK